MMLVPLALAALLAMAQVGLVPAFFLEPAAAPVLPVSLLAAWAALRGAGEVWPALLLPPLLLAAVSEERAGWFLLALLPAPLLAIAAGAPGPRSPLVAGLLAAGAGAGYLLVLLLAAGRPGLVLAEPELLASTVGWTAAVAVLLAVLLRPLRARRRTLYS